ncbi:MAG: hypothetical protein WA060_01240 [Minisyncoccia bacterium]
MKQETSAGVGEDKDLLIKRLIEFDDVTRHYLYVLDQMNEALTRGAGTEEVKKIVEEMNVQSSKFESFSDLTEVFSSAKETVDNKISVLKDTIREKKEGLKITPTEVAPTPILDVEKRLDDARAKYAEEYKKFLAGAEKFTRAKRFIFGAKIEDSEIPPELKELEKEYEKATVEYGNAMFSAKKTKNEIFTKVIIDEQTKLNALKAENLPPKEKNLAKKLLDWYMVQKRPTKIAMSFALSAGFAFTVLPSSVAAAGGSLAYLGIKTTRTFVGLGAGQGTAKLYDLIFKDKSEEERELAKQKLAEFFGEGNLSEVKKTYADILEKEQKSKRNRLIGKAMASMVVGGAASIGTGYGMGQILHPSAGHLDTPETKPGHLKTEIDTETPESIKTESATTGATETIKPDETAIIQKGEGIEHAFRRQIVENTELAKSLGFKGDVNDTKALYEFSGGAAHRVALEHGYVDKVTGEEIWVRPANEVAYQLKLENGELKVDELKVGSGLVEEHGSGSQFEEDTEKYEYKHPKSPTVETVASASHPETTSSPFNIKGNPYSETPESFHLGDKAYPPVHKFETENFPEKVEVSRVDTHTDVEATRAKVLEKMSTPNNTIRTGTRIGVGGAVEPGRGPGGTNYYYDSRFPGMNMGGPQYYFPGLSPDENDFLNHHPEFANNPFHLDGETLVRALKVHGHNVEHIFKDRDEWESFSNLKAKNWVHFGKIGEDSDPKLIYLNKLATITGIKPRGLASLHLRAETNGEYMARALQKAAEIGKLDQLKIKE